MAKKKSFKSPARKQTGPQKQSGSRSGGFGGAGKASGGAGKASGGKRGGARAGKSSGLGKQSRSGDSRNASEKRAVVGSSSESSQPEGFTGGDHSKRGPSKFRSGPPPKREGVSPAEPKGELQRLQRVLAAAGFGSRRQCEELIMEGRVEVDGKPATQLGIQVDPKRAEIFVDGSPVRSQRHVYFVLNKPPGVVTTNRDPQGRTRVIDLIQERERVFPVGRLDRNSEGLILLTNDGDLAQQLAHPRYGIQKVYRVTVAGKVDNDKLAQMREGIYIAEGRVAVDGAKIIRHRAHSTDLEILLREGKNREIRRILARLGNKVMTLQRIAIGPLRLGELPRGAYRPVTHAELKRIRDDIQRQSRREKDGFESGTDDQGSSFQQSTSRAGGEERRSGRPGRQRKSATSQRTNATYGAERSRGGRPERTPRKNTGATRNAEGKPERGKFVKKRSANVDDNFPFELSLEGSQSQGTVIGDLGTPAPEAKPDRPKRSSSGRVPRGGKPREGGRPGRIPKGTARRATKGKSTGTATTDNPGASEPRKKFGQGRKKRS